jgi:hypothetical protein
MPLRDPSARAPSIWNGLMHQVRLRFIAFASVAALAITAGGHAFADQSVVVAQLEILSPRLVYVDGAEPAAFEVDGLPCISGGGAVDVTIGRCPDSSATASGKLGTALLGFDAARRTDSGDSELPVVDTTSATADVLALRISVEVHREGEFRIEASAASDARVQPEFVSGSASPSAEVTGEKVSWRVGRLQPGTYSYAVKVRPRAQNGFSGSYVPEVLVERREVGGPLLPHLRGDGAGSALGSTQTTSVLRLEQRVAPATGPPRLTIEGPRSTRREAVSHEGSWVGRMTADFHGGWRVDRDSPADVRESRTLAELGYARNGVGCSGRSISYAVPSVHGAIKSSVSTPSFSDRFDMRIATSAVSDAPGEAFDGEAATVGYVLDAEASVGGDGRLPEDNLGTAAFVWDGTYADATWVEHTRATASTEIGVGDGTIPGFAAIGATRRGVLSLASLTMEVAGGDIDNRSSDEARTGTALRLTAPTGHVITSLTMLTGYCTGGGYQPASEFERAGPSPLGDVIAAKITPTIPAGKFWNEASGPPAGRLWVASTEAILRSVPSDSSGAPSTLEHVVTVSPGSHTTISHATPRHAFERTLTPGTWRVKTTSRGITVHPVALSSGPVARSRHICRACQG